MSTITSNQSKKSDSRRRKTTSKIIQKMKLPRPPEARPGAWVWLPVLLLLGCTTAIAENNATGAIHSPAQLQQLVEEAHTRFKDLKEGKNADYIPILAMVPPEH